MWKIVEEIKALPEFGDSLVAITAKDENSDWLATVKWDGCTTLSNHNTGSEIHICDLEAFRDMVTSLIEDVESQVIW